MKASVGVEKGRFCDQCMACLQGGRSRRVDLLRVDWLSWKLKVMLKNQGNQTGTVPGVCEQLKSQSRELCSHNATPGNTYVYLLPTVVLYMFPP